MDFDYNKLDAETRITVKQRETELDELARGTVDYMREMGFKLADIRRLLLYKKPGFVAWCIAKDFPVTTAYRLINLATKPQMSANSENILMIASLSEPQTPAEAKMQIEDAASSKEVVEAVVQGVITNHSLAMAATNDPEPDTINVNGSGETLTEVVTSGYVSLKDGSQVEPTSEAVIQSAHAHMSERNARKGQHMDDNKPIIVASGSVGDVLRQVADALAGYEGDVRIVVRAASMERVS